MCTSDKAGGRAIRRTLRLPWLQLGSTAAPAQTRRGSVRGGGSNAAFRDPHSSSSSTRSVAPPRAPAALRAAIKRASVCLAALMFFSEIAATPRPALTFLCTCIGWRELTRDPHTLYFVLRESPSACLPLVEKQGSRGVRPSWEGSRPRPRHHTQAGRATWLGAR